jgi:hypothetical protein
MEYLPTEFVEITTIDHGDQIGETAGGVHGHGIGLTHPHEHSRLTLLELTNKAKLDGLMLTTGEATEGRVEILHVPDRDLDRVVDDRVNTVVFVGRSELGEVAE